MNLVLHMANIMVIESILSPTGWVFLAQGLYFDDFELKAALLMLTRVVRCRKQ